MAGQDEEAAVTPLLDERHLAGAHTELDAILFATWPLSVYPAAPQSLPSPIVLNVLLAMLKAFSLSRPASKNWPCGLIGRWLHTVESYEA